MGPRIEGQIPEAKTRASLIMKRGRETAEERDTNTETPLPPIITVIAQQEEMNNWILSWGLTRNQ